MKHPDRLKTRYVYRAIVDRIYDGDSAFLSFDLGLRTWVRDVPCRLFGINTPELRSRDAEERLAGIHAKRALQDLLAIHSLARFDKHDEEVHGALPVVMVRTKKRRSGDDAAGKFGRWLVTLIGWDWTDGVPVDLNQRLIDTGHAVEYLP